MLVRDLVSGCAGAGAGRGDGASKTGGTCWVVWTVLRRPLIAQHVPCTPRQRTPLRGEPPCRCYGRRRHCRHSKTPPPASWRVRRRGGVREAGWDGGGCAHGGGSAGVDWAQAMGWTVAWDPLWEGIRLQGRRHLSSVHRVGVSARVTSIKSVQQS
ncbi:hypothetical protein FIBSPDRAFT_537366 [Athelia psychrophila]|uniref:Uncharacterized protein n=1 Tax=Athelia psychrophila TaxID=1759441 RepID=A0A166J7F5_9AGAM|nr:hypothetical protein FIBSPDRAFT_537366 [Fibularhizoctonia sp. CBS 109695]